MRFAIVLTAFAACLPLSANALPTTWRVSAEVTNTTVSGDTTALDPLLLSLAIGDTLTLDWTFDDSTLESPSSTGNTSLGIFYALTQGVATIGGAPLVMVPDSFDNSIVVRDNQGFGSYTDGVSLLGRASTGSGASHAMYQFSTDLLSASFSSLPGGPLSSDQLFSAPPSIALFPNSYGYLYHDLGSGASNRFVRVDYRPTAVSNPPVSVPEPGTLLLLSGGVLALSLARRRLSTSA